jgi:hypothetical protein
MTAPQNKIAHRRRVEIIASPDLEEPIRMVLTSVTFAERYAKSPRARRAAKALHQCLNVLLAAATC